MHINPLNRWSIQNNKCNRSTIQYAYVPAIYCYGKVCIKNKYKKLTNEILGIFLLAVVELLVPGQIHLVEQFHISILFICSDDILGKYYVHKARPTKALI